MNVRLASIYTCRGGTRSRTDNFLGLIHVLALLPVGFFQFIADSPELYGLLECLDVVFNGFGIVIDQLSF